MTDFLQAALKAQCSTCDISPSMVGNAAAVEDLVVRFLENTPGVDEHRLLKGWRGDLVGRHLLAFLKGELSLRMNGRDGGVLFEAVSENGRDC